MNQNAINELKENENSERADYHLPYLSRAATGGFFILMGGIFMLAMTDVTIFGRSAWWLVALLPTYWIVFAAYRQYKREGHFSGRVLSIAFFGLLPFIYMVAMMVGINIGSIWPLSLIFMGISFIFFNNRK